MRSRMSAERSITGHLNDLSTGNGSAANFSQLSGNSRAIVAGIASGAAEVQLNLIATEFLEMPREPR